MVASLPSFAPSAISASTNFFTTSIHPITHHSHSRPFDRSCRAFLLRNDRRSLRTVILRRQPHMNCGGTSDNIENDPLIVDNICHTALVGPTVHDFCESVQADIDAGGGDIGGNGPVNPDRRGDGENDDDLPADLTEALALNIVGAEAVTRYRNFMQIPILGNLMHIPSFRTRMLADSSFFFKLLIQEIVGNGTALASEIVVRGKHIVDELEYVASDLIVGTVVEAAFVWLLAPTLALPSQQVRSTLGKYLQALPANAFEASTALRAYSIPQRVASFFYAGAQYALIGFAAGIVGTAITYGIIEGRKAVDKSYSPKRPLPDVIPNSVAWGAFMALSSNTRFQIVEGMERGIAMMFNGTSAPVVNGGIVTLRFLNNYWGGVQFIQFFRFLGLHATEEEDH